MTIEIYINCDGNPDKPEVQISGSKKALKNFGVLLNTTEDSSRLELPTCNDEHYPVPLRSIVYSVREAKEDWAYVSINKEQLYLTGTKHTFNKIGDSLFNFFDEDAEVGDHFHLDYYEGNDVLAKTNCYLIFVCDRQ